MPLKKPLQVLCVMLVWAATLAAAEKAEAQAADTSKPYVIVPINYLGSEVPAGIAVPRGWRVADIFSDNLMLGRVGSGAGVPTNDENGESVHVGVLVSRDYPSDDTLDMTVEKLMKKLTAFPKTTLVGQESVEKLKLADGTDALLLTVEYIREGDGRRRFDCRVLAKDGTGRLWSAAGAIQAGKASKLPTKESELAQTLRSSVLTFCFDVKKVDVSKWKTSDKPTK